MYMHVYAHRNSLGSMLPCALFSHQTSLQLNTEALWLKFELAAAFVCNPAHQLCAGQYPVLPRHVSPHAWIEITMSSQAENPAKRGRLDSPPPTFGLCTLPEQPRYVIEAIV